MALFIQNNLPMERGVPLLHADAALQQIRKALGFIGYFLRAIGGWGWNSLHVCLHALVRLC